MFYLGGLGGQASILIHDAHAAVDRERSWICVFFVIFVIFVVQILVVRGVAQWFT